MFIPPRLSTAPSALTTTDVAPPRLAEAAALIQGWLGLSTAERRAQTAAVSTALRICRQPDPEGGLDLDGPAADPLLSCTDLNRRLFRRPPTAYNLTKPSFSNMLSQLRKVLRRLDLHDPKCPKAASLPPNWHVLHEALSSHRRLALQGFMNYCGQRGIAPEAVTSGTLTAFEQWLLERTLGDNAADKARAVASNWSWASRAVPGWPATPLQRPRMRESYVLPLTAFPPELQADVERFLAGLACTDLDDIFPDDADTSRSGSGRRKPARPRTIETRTFQLRQALTALVLLGQDAATLTSLRQLVEPLQQTRAIVKFYLDRAGNRRTSQTGGIAEVIRQVARHHCKVDDRAMQQITKWARSAAPEQQTTMSDKNRTRLQTLLQPHNKANLLHLPGRLMRQAADPDLQPHASVLLAMYAAALEILLVFPLRRSNLAKLRLDRELQYLGQKPDQVTHIRLLPSQTKNSEGALWPIEAQSSRLLQAYVRDHRPGLAAPGNPYLFPNTGMGHRAPHDLAVGLSRLVGREIGCRFNVHLARHFAVARFLERNPGQYEVARRILGHKTVKTTVDYYAGLEINAAARSLDASLALDRSATQLLAAAGRQGGRKRAAVKPLKTGG